jgi:hypothetical protein
MTYYELTEFAPSMMVILSIVLNILGAIKYRLEMSMVEQRNRKLNQRQEIIEFQEKFGRATTIRKQVGLLKKFQDQV